MSAENGAAKALMHEVGEAHLHDQIKQLVEKSNPDTRRLNINSQATCIIEKGDVLVELKHKRDEKDRAKKVPKRSRLNRAEDVHRERDGGAH
jgi:hypothetical protein